MPDKQNPQPLAEYWNKPEFLPDTEAGDPLYCIATTFEFDASYFETELLPRFLSLRFDHAERESIFILEREEKLCTTQVAVLVDSRKYDTRQATQRYRQLPIRIPGGIQHSKLAILTWENVIRLIVTSANLTKAGYRTNREVFAVIDFFEHAESAPSQILFDTLNFLERICSFADQYHPATEATQKCIDEIREKIRNWAITQNFTPRQKPSIKVASGHPAHQHFDSKSVFEQILEFWGNRPVDSIKIVTPFTTQDAISTAEIFRQLRRLPIKPHAIGFFVIPEIEKREPEKKVLVSAPKDFIERWDELFGRNARVLPIPKLVDKVDKRSRELHAKAVIIENEKHTLLLIGSSNFTLRGMGIGNVLNCEFNLIFEDFTNEKRDSLTLKDRLQLPVSWEKALACSKIIGKEEALQEAQKDMNAAEYEKWPDYFMMATFSQKTGKLSIPLNPNVVPLSAWTIYLDNEEQPLFSHDKTQKKVATLETSLNDKERELTITKLRLIWKDTSGVEHEGFIPVQPGNPLSDLLPPEELRNLSNESILNHWLSGKSIVEHYASVLEDLELESPLLAKENRYNVMDSLRAVDTSNYLLYRVRRFSRALTAMIDQIAQRNSISHATQYYLLHSPFGPAALAKSFIDLRSTNSEYSDQPIILKTEMNYRLYALSELLIAISYLGKYLKETQENNFKKIFLYFNETKKIIVEIIELLQKDAEDIFPDLQSYIEKCCAESETLL